ncbi:MAG: FUSC family protein [Oscillibacter sp.]|nr:aromatic acid exporter family protein [uncultured Oscillibacter sp.]MCI8813319.1 FUSC family protein [Oscillibacter sp.]
MSQTGQAPRPFPKIGMRNIKTALAAALCALIYYFLDRSPAFACIGAIFGMGSDLENSKLHGGNRLFGTVIGGLLGVAFFWVYLLFYPQGGHTLLLVPLVFIGTVALILLCQIFWVGGVQPGGVVLCIILFSTPVESYVTYALNRIFDTGIGVIMALVVNSVFPGGFTFRFMERFYRLFRKTAEEPANMIEKTEEEQDGISN